MSVYPRQASRAVPVPVAWFLASLLSASVTAVCAQISFRLPFTPVPVTLQVLGVILSGLILGSRLGALSQLQYLALGALGLPIFAGGTGGPLVLAGPTGGYLIGFIAGAFVIGLVVERFGGRTRACTAFAACAGIPVIYLFGALWLCIWMAMLQGKGIQAGLHAAWYLGVAPYIGIDLIKAIIASGLISGGKAGWGLVRQTREPFQG